MWRRLQTNLVEVGMRDRKSEFPLQIGNEESEYGEEE